MSSISAAGPNRRSGPDTRAAIGRVALDLFTRQGYEATSMREIAGALGIRKASLYYHFAGKEDILRSLVDQRGHEAEELVEWVAARPQDGELPKAAVMRWIDSFTAEKLRGIKFLAANPLLGRSLEAESGTRISSNLTILADRLAAMLPRQTPQEALRLRMALLSINIAVEAAADSDFTEQEILTAARDNAAAIMDALVSPVTQ